MAAILFIRLSVPKSGHYSYGNIKIKKQQRYFFK